MSENKKKSQNSNAVKAQELLDQLKAQKRANETRLKNIEQEREKLEKKHPSLGQKIEVLTKEISSQKTLIDTNSSTVIEQNKVLKDFEYELKNLENQREVNALKLSTQSIILSKSKKELGDRDNKIAELSAKVKGIQQTIETTEEDIASVKSKIRNREQREHDIALSMEISTQKIQKVSDEKESLERQLFETEKEIVDRQNKFDVKTEELEELTKSFHAVEDDLNASRKKNKEVLEELNKSNKSIEILHKKKELLSSEISKLEEQIDSFKSEISKNEKTKDALDRGNVIQEKLILTREQRLEEQKVDFDNVVAAVNEKQQQKDKNTLMLASLQEKIEKSQSVIAEKKSELVQLEDETARVEAALFNANVENEKLINLIESKKHTAEEITKKCSLLKTQLSNEMVVISNLKRTKDEVLHEEKMLTNSLRDLEEELAEKNHNKTILKDQLLEIRSNNNDLEEKIRNVKIQAENADDRIKKLTTEKTKETAKASERRTLLSTQESYLASLIDEIAKLDSVIQDYQNTARHQAKQINEYQTAIENYDQLAASNRQNIEVLKSEMESHLGTIESSDRKVRDVIESLFTQGEVLTAINKEASEYSSSVKHNLNEQKIVLTKLSDTAERSQNELRIKTHEIDELKKKVKETEEDITKVRKQIELKNEQNSSTRQRIDQYEVTVKEQVEMLATLEEEKGTSENLLHDQEHVEREIIGKIHHFQTLLETAKEENANEKLRLTSKQDEVNRLNAELEKLQAEESANRTLLRQQQETTHTLGIDLTELEECVKDYQDKVKRQQRRIDENHDNIEALKERNKALSQEFTQKAALYEKLTKQETGEVAQVEKLAKYEAKVRQEKKVLEEKLHAMGVDSIPADSDSGIQVTFSNHIKAIKQKLETKFFNMTFDYSKAQAQSVHEYDPMTLTIMDETLSNMISTVESTLGPEAESAAEIRVHDNKVTCFLAITNFSSHTNNSVAKEALAPVGRTLLSQYRDNGLAISYRVKVRGNGEIDKLGVTVEIPLAPVSEQTDKRDSEESV